MSDPKFESVEALEAWRRVQNSNLIDCKAVGLDVTAQRLREQIARVTLAHQHLRGSQCEK